MRLSALEIERHRKRAATLDSYFQQDDNCKRMKNNVTEDKRDLSVEEADSNKIGINSVQGREVGVSLHLYNRGGGIHRGNSY